MEAEAEAEAEAMPSKRVEAEAEAMLFEMVETIFLWNASWKSSLKKKYDSCLTAIFMYIVGIKNFIFGDCWSISRVWPEQNKSVIFCNIRFGEESGSTLVGINQT